MTRHIRSVMQSLFVMLLCLALANHTANANPIALKVTKGQAQVSTLGEGYPVTVEVAGLAAETLFRKLISAGKQPQPCLNSKLVRNENIACYQFIGKKSYRCIFDMDLENSNVIYREMCTQNGIIGVMN